MNGNFYSGALKLSLPHNVLKPTNRWDWRSWNKINFTEQVCMNHRTFFDTALFFDLKTRRTVGSNNTDHIKRYYTIRFIMFRKLLWPCKLFAGKLDAVVSFVVCIVYTNIIRVFFFFFYPHVLRIFSLKNNN